MRQAAHQLASSVGLAPACRALGVPRASLYRHRHPHPPSTSPRPTPARALAPAERRSVLEQLHAQRFLDQSPQEVYATLLDEGRYLCSLRTMYRLLTAHDEVRERRDQLRHPSHPKPQLLTIQPNQVWTWDITKLLGPAKWTFFYLYVILDLFSRYVVGWMVAERESRHLAARLIAETCRKQQILPGQLRLHADRGAPMTAQTVAQLLAQLGVIKTHSRPHTANDNPFSESQFKTLKYRPEFPDRFGALAAARGFCGPFFTWYNTQHHHSALALLTPEVVHYGRAPHLLARRQQVLTQAYLAHPERFVRHPPRPPQLPAAVWINPPALQPATDGDLH